MRPLYVHEDRVLVAPPIRPPTIPPAATAEEKEAKKLEFQLWLRAHASRVGLHFLHLDVRPSTEKDERRRQNPVARRQRAPAEPPVPVANGPMRLRDTPERQQRRRQVHPPPQILFGPEHDDDDEDEDE